jgi:hypothetical protein
MIRTSSKFAPFGLFPGIGEVLAGLKVGNATVVDGVVRSEVHGILISWPTADRPDCGHERRCGHRTSAASQHLVTPFDRLVVAKGVPSVPGTAVSFDVELPPMPGAHDVQRVPGKPRTPVSLVLINERLDLVDKQAFADWSTLIWADKQIAGPSRELAQSDAGHTR